MDEGRKRLLALRDDRLPALPAMLGSEAAELLDAAAGGVGANVLSARPIQITWRPAHSLHVTYDVSVAWNNHHHSSDRFVAATGGQLPQGAVLLARDQAQVAVWRMSNDPVLPGLAVAMSAERIREILPELKIPEGPVSARVRAYRPERRAVVEVNGGGLRFYLKIVPPASIAGLQERHRVLSEHLPVPRSHGWSSEHGLVVLEALPGETLRTGLLTKKRPLPAPQTLTALLDRLPAVPDERAVRTHLALAPEYGRVIKSILPELSDRIDGLLADMSPRGTEPPAVPVHGDFHEAQLLIKDGAISGLLDIDSAGSGQRIDDWANLLGHLAAWEISTAREVRPRIAGFARGVLAEAESDTGHGAELRRRTSAVILGMATGPFRAQSRTWPSDTRNRIALAERWLSEAKVSV